MGVSRRREVDVEEDERLLIWIERNLVSHQSKALPNSRASMARSMLSVETAKRPMTIMGKKLPMIHSNIIVTVRRRGPTKKNMPLPLGQRLMVRDVLHNMILLTLQGRNL